MELFVFLALLVALAPGCDLQTPEVDAPDALGDAAALALRYQLEVARGSVTVELPEALVRELASVLARVRASEHGGLVAGIHAVPPYALRNVVLTVDTSSVWVVDLRRGDSQTRDPRVDRLLSRYALTLTEIDVYPEDRYALALIQSKGPLNPVALAPRFRSAPGIRYSNPNAVGTGGDTDDILAERAPRGWRSTVIRGTGGIFAPGTSRGIWDFRVAGRTVEYLGARDR